MWRSITPRRLEPPSWLVDERQMSQSSPRRVYQQYRRGSLPPSLLVRRSISPRTSKNSRSSQMREADVEADRPNAATKTAIAALARSAADAIHALLTRRTGHFRRRHNDQTARRHQL